MDAEHNKNADNLEAYLNLKNRLRTELSLHLNIPTLENVAVEGIKNLKSSVHVGNIKPLYDSIKTVIPEAGIKIYYIKMAVPTSLNNLLDEDSSYYTLGDSINRDFLRNMLVGGTNDEYNNKQCGDSTNTFMRTDVHQTSALAAYWVQSYRSWLDGRCFLKRLNYRFPQTPTLDQSWYRDQFTAFVGLGYLEAMELRWLIK